MTTLRPGEKPALPAVRVAPAGTHTFIGALAAHAPALGAALKFRPKGLGELSPEVRDGLRNQLRELQTQLTATLADIEVIAAPVPQVSQPAVSQASSLQTAHS